MKPVAKRFRREIARKILGAQLRVKKQTTDNRLNKVSNSVRVGHLEFTSIQNGGLFSISRYSV